MTKDLMDFSPVQQMLILGFVANNGQVEMRDVDPVISMIENGTIEFGCVGAANEHLHIPGPGMCERCRVVTIKEAAIKILGA